MNAPESTAAEVATLRAEVAELRETLIAVGVWTGALCPRCQRRIDRTRSPVWAVKWQAPADWGHARGCRIEALAASQDRQAAAAQMAARVAARRNGESA